MLTKPFYGRVLFNADSGNAGGNSGGSDDNLDGAKPDGKDTDEFKPITSESELAGWKGRTKKAILEEVKAELAREQEAKDRQADEARQRDEQAKRGEFDEIRKDLEGKLTAADSEKQALKSERDALADYFNGQYQAALKDLPEVVTAFAPAEDASFAVKQAWLTKATEQAAKHQSQAPGYRVPPTPQPQGRGNPTEQQMADRMRSSISI